MAWEGQRQSDEKLWAPPPASERKDGPVLRAGAQGMGDRGAILLLCHRLPALPRASHLVSLCSRSPFVQEGEQSCPAAQGCCEVDSIKDGEVLRSSRDSGHRCPLDRFSFLASAVKLVQSWGFSSHLHQTLSCLRTMSHFLICQ